MLKPATLRPGDLVAVVAPAAAIDPTTLATGVRALERLGYRVRVGASVQRRNGYLAGQDAERARDVINAFVDPAVRAIIAARGGYGAGRLLPLLDLEIVRAHPKIFLGHSDLTFLLSHFSQQGELVTFHGPMVSGLVAETDGAQQLVALLSGDRSTWKMSARDIVQPGIGEGVLTGGCLSVVVAMLGTPYELDTAGRLLLLEDVNEKPYRIDRMLTQLRHAGKLEEVAGVIFGEMTGCVADPREAFTVRDVIAQEFADAPYPVVIGLPTGHGEGGMTLPLGVRARLAGERLTLLEAPLSR
jgi:muramoyltetrapeptide carboxypeptidase